MSRSLGLDARATAESLVRLTIGSSRVRWAEVIEDALVAAYDAGRQSVHVPTVEAVPCEDRKPLTGRQAEVFSFIALSISRTGLAPTLREIGEHMGITSTNGVTDHLKYLEAKGWIRRSSWQTRGIELTSLTLAQVVAHEGVLAGDVWARPAGAQGSGYAYTVIDGALSRRPSDGLTTPLYHLTIDEIGGLWDVVSPGTVVHEARQKTLDSAAVSR